MPRGVKVYGVAKMETAHIACRVEANPPQVGFRWTFNNSAEAKQGRQTGSPSPSSPQTQLNKRAPVPPVQKATNLLMD